MSNKNRVITFRVNKKEVLELKKRFKKDQATFTRLVGCYVDCNREKICKFGGKFLTLEEEEYYKYLEIANKVLSGTLGNNLLNLSFPIEEEQVGGRHRDPLLVGGLIYGRHRKEHRFMGRERAGAPGFDRPGKRNRSMDHVRARHRGLDSLHQHLTNLA